MANIPPLKVLPSAFAQFALDTYKNVIAAIRGNSTPSNAATYQDGFGEATFKPVSSENDSGIPPRGGDVNGILNDLSTPIYRAQMGLPINTWDASIASQGYPKGAIVIYPNGDSISKKTYISLQNNNTLVPNNSSYWQELNPPQSLQSYVRFPNYAARRSRSVGANYTEIEDGWVYVTGAINNGTASFAINGIEYIFNADMIIGGHVGSNLMLPIKAGNTYRLNSGTTTWGYYFIPCI